MTMLNNPSLKYKKFDSHLNLASRQWPSKEFTRPPRWLSTDLRDGNQSLPDPMTVEEKKKYFKKLVEIGFKEIEVAFPSASQIDFDFTRWCVENAPADVSIQVLAPCREPLIKRTVESLKGAKKATVHIYMATSDCFREVVFGLSKEETKEQATKCTKYVRELTKDDPAMRDTYWQFEFSPETFSDTDPNYALDVCESVKAAWEPSKENPIIFNLPATVEMTTPNVYADQIEYFCDNISEREKVCVSLHPHNDRGCAVAAAELAQLAGADRVEGCLFGNGERTGNVDLVTLALNLYTQGIHPKLDFSDINSVIEVVEKCNKIPVHPRAPYGGQLVVCAFSGSHQDAIKKGFKQTADKKRKLEEEAKKTGKKPKISQWRMPYLPLDPQDIGRTYEAIIRVNSQSGKGGVSWIILRNLELDLPRGLQIEFSKVVQRETEAKTRELKTVEIIELFENEYIVYPEKTEENLKRVNAFRLDQYHITTKDSGRRVVTSTIRNNDTEIKLSGEGNGPLSAFTDSLFRHFGETFDVVNYHEHSLGKDSNSLAASYINCRIGSNPPLWGVGINEDVSVAGFNALISSLNQSLAKGLLRLN
ncbi:DEKNAAC104657 [Brettanomyces naardenensis]|uniref:2-isopropylmalate synthase n=1 Tax=Brettanomyces naardenensis TaxID=13370 RepID=A0A448YRK2_BRENA|nr:DEKNAAC104657 [Brettanomyces naardenensis]